MRVLLVTFSDILPFALTKVLNPELDYCAIVVDEPEISKKMLENIPQFNDKIFPFYELKECVENFYYDYVLCITDGRLFWSAHSRFVAYGLPRNKFFHVAITPNGTLELQVDRALRYYSEHSTEFEMFATGISYISVALDADKFKYKLINFGLSSQDLYYDYQVAKFIFSTMHEGGAEKSRIKYALIGLAPYSFTYDLSQTYANHFQLLKYYVAFNDVHNFWIPKEKISEFLRKDYLSIRAPSGIVSLNNIYGTKTDLRIMGWVQQWDARETIDTWKGRHYPETVKENIQILDDYLKLCEKNNVRPIMFLPTMTQGYIKYFERSTIDEFYYLVYEALKKHLTAVFVDGWKFQGFSEKDFYDPAHLNIQGAAKFSAILNNAIEQLERMS